MFYLYSISDLRSLQLRDFWTGKVFIPFLDNMQFLSTGQMPKCAPTSLLVFWKFERCWVQRQEHLWSALCGGLTKTRYGGLKLLQKGLKLS